jgi:hypothetical protein
MSYLQNKIATFFKKRNEMFKTPLEKIIKIMLDKCRYINEESLERHNWGNAPTKLKNIPKNLKSPSFEEDLLNALNLEDNEKSIVELLWGDIQLGKRVHACIVMWFSVYILKRPVLYIFRNLLIDQKQLQDDIVGTEKYNFNIQFIKSSFEEFNIALQEYFEETNVDYWKDYKLPDLKDINSDIINKLCNKEAINSNEIFCCLMNHNQLAKINTKFSEYIYYNNELVDLTVLVDESDLMSPTSSNDRTNDNDIKDSTACEILLAKIYKKVKYTLHITGTAHSLLYNITTRLSDNQDIQTKISKVHKMKRATDYFGLFNNCITFNTTLVENWWNCQDTENTKKASYNIVEDYNINIKKIIEEILKRESIKYNSLLISEEKIKVNQIYLVDKIIKDFSDLFIVIYHGKCLRLYISKKYEQEIKSWSFWDSKETSSQRMHQNGGVYGSSIDTDKSEKLPNNYCYFNIDTRILNIKILYKLLRILFERSDIPIAYKTVITITGKYGERGYSFTSDDYDNYSLHLTDQYFVSHASFNCTDISQRLRLQGKYNDPELKNENMKLTLWTTHELQDIIQNFYVKFIKEIEKFIMSCHNWEEIKDLLESIIDNGEFKFGKYMKYIDVSKKRKNLKPIKHYDSKNNGYRLIIIDDMNDTEICEWCKETNLPDYICINEIKKINLSELNNNDKSWYSNLIEIDYNKENDLKCQKYTLTNETSESYKKKIYKCINNKIINSYNLLAIQNKCVDKDEHILIIDEINKKKYIGTFKPENYNINYTSNIHQNVLKLKKSILYLHNNVILNSVPREEYKQQNTHGYTNEDRDEFIEDDNGLPTKYYWKTPDGWLYLYDKDKPEIISLNIVAPLPTKNIIETEPVINSDVLLFTQFCCKKTDRTNLRFGLKDIYTIYETWCKINGKKCLKPQKKFREEFEKKNYKEEHSKGVDINNNPGKRGYNVMVSL